MPEVGAVVLRKRFLESPLIGQGQNSGSMGAAGQVLFAPLDVPWPVIIDRIGYVIGATATGDVRLAIYREGPALNTPEGGALVVESAAVAQPGTNRLQVLEVEETLLTPGRYWIAMQTDGSGGTYINYNAVSGWGGYYYIRPAGFGAFDDPCIVGGTMGPLPIGVVRVAENLPAGSLHS